MLIWGLSVEIKSKRICLICVRWFGFPLYDLANCEVYNVVKMWSCNRRVIINIPQENNGV